MEKKILACIQCGVPLLELKCKLKCPRCGYFEDCLPEQPALLCGTASRCSDGGNNAAQETNFPFQDKQHLFLRYDDAASA